jgi:hypothetical protein
MTPEIGVTLPELITVGGAIVGAIWALGKLAVGQLNERINAKFKIIDEKLATFDALHTKLAAVDKDLIQVRLEMAQNFVRQEGLRTLQTRMEQLFGEIFDKLDSKADKSECERAHPHR